MKKTIFKDEWGEITEYTRFRGKGGRFVSDKWGKRALKKKKPWIKKETVQWRSRKGKRTEKISIQTPDVVMKKTYPGGIDSVEGDIYEALRNTNIFTQVARAQTAHINIRGQREDGRYIRLQGEITIGGKNQDMQLMMAVKEIMASAGYRTYYSLQVVKSPKLRRQVAKLQPLMDTTFTVTLYK